MAMTNFNGPRPCDGCGKRRAPDSFRLCPECHNAVTAIKPSPLAAAAEYPAMMEDVAIQDGLKALRTFGNTIPFAVATAETIAKPEARITEVEAELARLREASKPNVAEREEGPVQFVQCNPEFAEIISHLREYIERWEKDHPGTTIKLTGDFQWALIDLPDQNGWVRAVHGPQRRVTITMTDVARSDELLRAYYYRDGNRTACGAHVDSFSPRGETEVEKSS